jgi:abortive infection bacteriophage resistance protein
MKSSRTKRDIANSFAFLDVFFDSWLHTLACVRNMSSHHVRVWNSLITIQPLSPRKPQNTWLTNTFTHNNRIYYTLSVIIYLLNVINPKHTFKEKMKGLFQTNLQATLRLNILLSSQIL